MSGEVILSPEHWLLCGHEVALAVRTTCVRSAPPRSLPIMRIASGLVVDTDLGGLRQRIVATTGAGDGPVNVVVARLSTLETATMSDLSDLGADVRIHVWQDQAFEIEQLLNAPDERVESAWMRKGSRPVFLLQGPELGRWSTAYAVALSIYENGARSIDPDGFEALYGYRCDELQPKAELEKSGARAAGDDDLPHATLSWEGDSTSRLVLVLADKGEDEASFAMVEFALGLAELSAAAAIEVRFHLLNTRQPFGRPLEFTAPVGGFQWLPRRHAVGYYTRIVVATTRIQASLGDATRLPRLGITLVLKQRHASDGT